ncbi:MAG: hypothetical protein HZA72_03755 [Candidatus Omnitrophica bacterium]|nr:hypothetical protein [Candidatus Omnitrophota bacterium]
MKKLCNAAFMVLIISVIVLSAGSVFAQEEESKMPAPVQTAAAQAPVKEEAAKVQELSIYGEVQSVNTQAGSLAVQYYDYDNDEEKSIEIAIDKDSKLENVKAIDEIKKGDWVDVTYIVSAGKNMAKMVSVEKEELAGEEGAPAESE